jgi:phenylacetate-CoA ligase
MTPKLSSFLFSAAIFLEALRSKEVAKALKLLDKSDMSTRSDRMELANEAFRDLIKNISVHCPYYKEYFLTHGFKSSDFNTIEDLRKLPILTKDLIKKNRERFISKDPSNRDYLSRTSGGTTGEPIQIEVDRQTRINDLYFYYRGLRWMGWRPGYPMVKFFGGSLGGNNAPTIKNKIKKFVSGEFFLPAFKLDKSSALYYLDTIKSLGNCYIQGYVSSIYTLATLARELNYKGLQIKGVFTTAEQLPLEQAEFINETFNCNVKAYYGCAEINCLGFQLETNGDYRSPEEIVALEKITHPEISIDNAFLVSSLYNKRMPLLRYLNGDSGEILIKDDMTLISELSGRTADMFVSKSRGFISSIVATQTMQITGLTHKIKRYQLIQISEKNIEFRYQVFEGQRICPSDLQKIIEMYLDRFGKEFIIETVETEYFIKSNTGKHRLMINQFIN